MQSNMGKKFSKKALRERGNVVTAFINKIYR